MIPDLSPFPKTEAPPTPEYGKVAWQARSLKYLNESSRHRAIHQAIISLMSAFQWTWRTRRLPIYKFISRVQNASKGKKT